jgi:hypothetical protein
MMFQLLIPGVQHHQRCRFDALLFSQLVSQGAPCGLKQQSVDLATIAQRDPR